VRFFFEEHGGNLTLGRAVDAGVGPTLFPAIQIGLRFLQALETHPFERCSLGVAGRSLIPLSLCPKPSTARDLVDSREVRIIHPFHPLCGQTFRFVVSKKLWGEDRVTIQLADGSLFSVPVSWTDVVPADTYTSVGGRRSRFRVEDLMALADLLALKRSR
jgi:Family of unknown function (DUF5372)